MIAALKIIHIAAISIWAAGLLGLPSLYARRDPGASAAQTRVHRGVRFIYVGLMSPAALAAIISGIGLMFLRETFTPWFTAKLLFVGLMVALHLATGRQVLRLFEAEHPYSGWRHAGHLALAGGAITMVIALVLMKPALHFALPDGLMEPGGLSRALPGFNLPEVP